MFRFYTPILLLQLFCLYHIFTKSAETKWYYLVIFFPAIGSIFYLYYHFWNRHNLDNISENLKTIVKKNYAIEKLEKEIIHSPTIKKKIQLGDEYLKINENHMALDIYKECQTSLYKNDSELLMRLLKSSYLCGNYEEAVEFGEKLNLDKSFKNSLERIYYAWSLSHVGLPNEAEEVFKDMDGLFTNFKARLEYSKFLHANDKISEGDKILDSIMDELDHLDNYEKRINRETIKEVNGYYRSR